MKKLFFLLLISFFFSGCEKDDICDTATPTTPKVVIEFYDAVATTTTKNVNNLIITATGFTSEIKYNAVNKITVPLKTFTDIATLNFNLNAGADPTTDDNLDEITFNYTRKTNYVSRACGYKTTFTLDATNPVVVTPDASNWILNVIVSQPNIENQNETHVKIYF
ncbi:DUF6452 family protein [Flavobacterium facile]|uniref:DUF6452 family protein n=1 Tax=Flavobacterium facile TaxID=2893174 RepID=UPI002E787693|nr:DUF6452 family protein [Flavobacterium sp. T-12]